MIILSKVYIVTSGEYSDYHIDACFSTKQKAQEFIRNAEKTEELWDRPRIEEWDLDGSVDIVDVVTISFTFTSPFSKTNHNEKVESVVDKIVGCKVRKSIEFYGFDYNILRIQEIANPNKTIEEEIARLTKVAYDTAKKINYLYKVENIKTPEGIRKRLGWLNE